MLVFSFMLLLLLVRVSDPPSSICLRFLLLTVHVMLLLLPLNMRSSGRKRWKKDEMLPAVVENKHVIMLEYEHPPKDVAYVNELIDECYHEYGGTLAEEFIEVASGVFNADIVSISFRSVLLGKKDVLAWSFPRTIKEM
ncbi:uncharacterized protein LOC141707887 isoform X1 [Apium graveolens]|uniref:uncharacterized protein LOC141707887 isoform X1 n=1 Tax=Apium graveolens TaxID=4045 RepID=UPI003D78B4A6